MKIFNLSENVVICFTCSDVHFQIIQHSGRGGFVRPCTPLSFKKIGENTEMNKTTYINFARCS